MHDADTYYTRAVCDEWTRRGRVRWKFIFWGGGEGGGSAFHSFWAHNKQPKGNNNNNNLYSWHIQAGYLGLYQYGNVYDFTFLVYNTNIGVSYDTISVSLYRF